MNKAWILIVLCVAACSSVPREQAPQPRTLAAALQVADAHYRKRDLSAAERAYEGVLAMDSESVEANIRLGVIAHQQGKYALAEEHFNQVLRDDPRNEAAAYNLAVLHVQQASELFERYLSVSSPKSAERPAVYELRRAMQEFREH